MSINAQTSHDTNTKTHPHILPLTGKVIDAKQKAKRKSSCYQCRKSHLSCDGERPCQRCKKRKSVDCVDVPPKDTPFLTPHSASSSNCIMPLQCQTLNKSHNNSEIRNNNPFTMVTGENGVMTMIPQRTASHPAQNIGLFWKDYSSAFGNGKDGKLSCDKRKAKRIPQNRSKKECLQNHSEITTQSLEAPQLKNPGDAFNIQTLLNNSDCLPNFQDSFKNQIQPLNGVINGQFKRNLESLSTETNSFSTNNTTFQPNNSYSLQQSSFSYQNGHQFITPDSLRNGFDQNPDYSEYIGKSMHSELPVQSELPVSNAIDFFSGEENISPFKEQSYIGNIEDLSTCFSSTFAKNVAQSHPMLSSSDKEYHLLFESWIERYPPTQNVCTKKQDDTCGACPYRTQ